MPFVQLYRPLCQAIRYNNYMQAAARSPILVAEKSTLQRWNRIAAILQPDQLEKLSGAHPRPRFHIIMV